MRASRRVVLTRPPEDNQRLRAAIGEGAAEFIEYPCIAIEPLPIAHGVLEKVSSSLYDAAVFVSRNGVTRFFEEVEAASQPRPSRPRQVLAIGNGTAELLVQNGWPPTALPSDARAEVAVVELDSLLHGEGAVLHVRGEIGGTLIQDALRKRGRTVDEAILYRTVDPVTTPLPRSEVSTLIVFASPSAVRHFMAHNEEPVGEALAIGETTAAAARRAGFTVGVLPSSDLQGLADEVRRWIG